MQACVLYLCCNSPISVDSDEYLNVSLEDVEKLLHRRTPQTHTEVDEAAAAATRSAKKTVSASSAAEAAAAAAAAEGIEEDEAFLNDLDPNQLKEMRKNGELN